MPCTFALRSVSRSEFARTDLIRNRLKLVCYKLRQFPSLFVIYEGIICRAGSAGNIRKWPTSRYPFSRLRHIYSLSLNRWRSAGRFVPRPCRTALYPKANHVPLAEDQPSAIYSLLVSTKVRLPHEACLALLRYRMPYMKKGRWVMTPIALHLWRLVRDRDTQRVSPRARWV